MEVLSSTLHLYMVTVSLAFITNIVLDI